MQVPVLPLQLEASRCNVACRFAMLLLAAWLLVACASDSDAATQDSGARDQPDANDKVPDANAGKLDAGQDGGPALVSCGDVTVNGRCASPTRVQVCVIPATAAAPARLEGYDCRVGESCSDADGVARCLLTSECADGDTDCRDADTLKSCVAGKWSDADCSSARCIESALGAVCAPSVATQRLQGTLKYEARAPDLDEELPIEKQMPNWAVTKSAFPARGFAVLSYVDDALLDATYTDGSGVFSLLGPASPTANDAIVILCAGRDRAGRMAFAVANPGYAPSDLIPRQPFEMPPKPALWSYSFALNAFANNDLITIAESQGSAAAHVYDTVQNALVDLEPFYVPPKPDTVVVWVSPGTKWSCGACTARNPLEVAGQIFLHQVWLDGSSQNQGYWSDAVTAHELGHYAMAAYGFPPAESGGHDLAVATNPGQAWSEGWATFFSSLQRGSSKYYDKQNDTFFWFDLEKRDYVPFDDESYAWTRATASAGIDQLMDENEVAALLHGTKLSIGSKQPMLIALASLRMRIPPFERGYTLRTWTDPMTPGIYMSTKESIPYLADYFDALRCANAISGGALDLVTEPATRYPYPSASPLCR